MGFTCWQVLILLPLRSTALRVVSRLLELAQKETRTDSIQNKQRFLEDFGADEDEPGGNRVAPGGGSGGAANTGRGPPAEHAALFEGNSDDHFRLGIKVTRSGTWLVDSSCLLVAQFINTDACCLCRVKACICCRFPIPVVMLVK